MPEEPGITMAQVMELVSKMTAAQNENMLAAIAEMKKPSAREQAKLDKEDARVAAQQEARLKVGMAEEQRKQNIRRGCPHSTYHPGTGVRKHAWRAKTYTPHNEQPFWMAICVQCQTLGPKVPATLHQLQNGVNLDQYASVSFEEMEEWVKLAKKEQPKTA
jgi:hypothetical protein